MAKTPTTVDSSAAYMKRRVAKENVAAELADRCEDQLADASGAAEPGTVYVDTKGTGRVDDDRPCEAVRTSFLISPSGITKYLNMRWTMHRTSAAGLVSAAANSNLLESQRSGPPNWPTP